ncbi:family 20 glycosylhydrolase [Spirosoma taeanense]|uniref:beta-N-acetylhexosaminidase n=1 Tax=Spirosoma taeanense TaxID=2735870 RepID=A0A6M5Y643_9BACT|nr:family 20 glycosylhydrolase [Spirosoma taeanense]QJW88523.1 family 20 glycosylhydrolase [Spirosoma taeanense]
MKHVVLILFLLITLTGKAQTNPIHLIPQPVDVKPLTGKFLLTKTTVISYTQPQSRSVAEMLAEKLSTPTGYGFKARQGRVTSGKTAAPGSIELSLNTTPSAQLGNEGYTLEVSPRAVKLSANQPAGLYYGMQTLLQLFPKEMASKTLAQSTWSAPCVQITDYPRFGWRGVMLDVSRHFFPKEDVKRFIDEIAQLKYNTFHWHLTDDQGWRIEIKSLPKLTQVGAWRVPRVGKFGQLEAPRPGEAPTDGGFYTQDDIREIVRYAQERNVTIVPEIDVPGHSMAAIAAYPELSCTRDTSTKVNPGSNFAEWFGNGTFKMFIDNTLNPSDENVYVFLDKVFTEVAQLFPNSYIHAGGDECYKGYWEKDPGCQALMQKMNMKNVEELQGYFMKRVEQILKRKGKKLIGWDEILEGGIAPEATVMSWRGIKGGIEAAHLGHNVVMTPSQYVYIDLMQGDPTLDPPIYSTVRLKTSYNFEPVPEGIDPKFILGGQANLWTEAINTISHAEYMTYPRAWALADVYWSPKDSKNWAAFVPRMETQFGRADQAGINYARSAYDPMVTTVLKGDKLVATLDAEIPDLDIFYTIDDSVPGQYSPKYSTPIEIPEGPVTLRVITYRAGKPIGRMLTLKRDELKKRVK